MKHTTKRPILIAVVALALLVAGIVLINASRETIYLPASWEYGYRDIEEIARASDAIALVKVDKELPSYEEQGTPFTKFSTKVMTPIHNISDASLTIVMTGKKDFLRTFEIKEDPLLHPGDEYLIFCRKNADGSYTILGGPQGRLIHTKGKLRSFYANSGITVNDADADTFIKQIHSYLQAS